MKTINKIFNGIRKVIAFPITAIGFIITLAGIIIIAGGISISGSKENILEPAKANLSLKIEELRNEIEKAKKEKEE